MEDPLSTIFTDILQISSQSGSAFGQIAGLAGLIVLLLISAFVSGAEVAFFSLTTQDKQILEERSTRISRLTIDLIERPRQLLATILIANNTVNIAIVILSTILIDPLLGDTSETVKFLIQVICVTFLILLIGEVTPKVYATKHALSFSGVMTLPLYVLRKVLTPLSLLLMGTSKLVESVFRPATHNISVDELSHALELTSKEQAHDNEQQILKGIVKFGNTEVRQIMQPRLSVTAFDYETPFRDLLRKIMDAGFSRVPVYRDHLDNVVGVLYIKDLLNHIDEDNEYAWQQLVRNPFFVPENKKIDDLLKEFQEKKIHLAVVVDEYGGSSGIITMEDIIEEIVGDISDEFDDDDLVYSRLDDHNYIFEGRTQLNDLYRVLRISGEEFERSKGDSDTLAGFLLEMEGRIPEKNAELRFERYIFRIEAADKRRIKSVKITILPAQTAEADEKNR